MECFVGIVDPFTIFGKFSILDVWQDSEYLSEYPLNYGILKPVWDFHVKSSDHSRACACKALDWIKYQFLESTSQIFLNCFKKDYSSVIKYTLSKFPGGHPILHQGLKLNSKISAGNIKKIKFTRTNWFFNGELAKRYV